MAELLTAARMRAIEAAAIASGAVTGLELMERAGQGVVEAVIEHWPELGGRGAGPSRSPEYLQKDEEALRAVVLCGPGNNGGDGFVVARLLQARGWEVEVFLHGDPEKLPPDAKANFERWREMGEVSPLPAGLEPSTRKAALVVDALFGTGLTRPINGLGVLFLDLQNSRRQGAGLPEGDRPGRCPRLVSIDLPSGLCSDSGRTLLPEGYRGLPDKLEAAVACSDLTVAFHRRKPCHVLSDGPDLCGKTVVKSIGLGASPAAVEASRPVPLPGDVVRLTGRPSVPALSKVAHRHKYAHGHALVLSGGAGRTGAARLAARGALRIGAGLVTLGVAPSAQLEAAARVTAVMLRRVADAPGLAGVLADERFNALCLGPGLGMERARVLVPAALRSGRAAVLDADALTAFADAPDALFEMLHDKCVLTPHAGEFARLFPDLAARLADAPYKGPAYSKVDATRTAAARAGCVVLFKGPDTVIAAPDGGASVNSAHYERSAPWLATAGSGDVLAGFITGLMARGFAPMRAAETAGWLHVDCALDFGPGLIAEDLPERLPAVFRKLGLQAARTADSAVPGAASSSPPA